MNDLFPHIQGFAIVPDNAKTHKSAFHLTANNSRRRRRRNSPPSSAIPFDFAQRPPQAQAPTNRWDSSSNDTCPDALMKTPRRSSGDDSDSESSRYEELFLRPCNIQKCQSWPSPKDDSTSRSLLLGGQLHGQDNLHRMTLDSMVHRQKRATPLPSLTTSSTDNERGVERSSSLQDWFTPPTIYAGLHVHDQGRLNHWSGHPRDEDESSRDSAAVLQSVFETLGRDLQDTQL